MQDAAVGLVVVHDEHAQVAQARADCRGRRPPSGLFSSFVVNQNVEPSPGSLLTPISPPIISTSCLLMARPSPVPP